jgi:hypothetical protein
LSPRNGLTDDEALIPEIRQRFGTEHPVGAGRCADRLGERLGLDVEPAAVAQLAAGVGVVGTGHHDIGPAVDVGQAATAYPVALTVGGASGSANTISVPMLLTLENDHHRCAGGDAPQTVSGTLRVAVANLHTGIAPAEVRPDLRRAPPASRQLHRRE